MGEDTGAIEREIRETRAQLGSTVDALEAKATRAMDWRQKFRESPKAGLAVAFGVGVIASGMLSGDSEYNSRRKSGRTSAAVNSLKTALLGMLAMEVRRYAQRQLGLRSSDHRAA